MTDQLLVMFVISLKKTCWCETTLQHFVSIMTGHGKSGVYQQCFVYEHTDWHGTQPNFIYARPHFSLKTKSFSSVCNIQFVCDVNVMYIKVWNPCTYTPHHPKKQFILLNKFHRYCPQTQSSTVRTDHNPSRHLHFLCNRHVSLTEQHIQSQFGVACQLNSWNITYSNSAEIKCQ
jgi:hypothetical protein